MKRDPIKAEVLATKIIPNVSPDMAKELNLEPGMKSLALITANSDDVTYTALDEATKKADVKVVYAKSFYGGADNANTKLAGEIIGIDRFSGGVVSGGVGAVVTAAGGQRQSHCQDKNHAQRFFHFLFLHIFI